MKTLLKVGLVLGVLVIAAGVLVYVFLDKIVEAGVETGLQHVTEAGVQIDGLDLQPFAGRLTMAQLTVGHPPGFGDAGAMLDLSGLDLAVDTASLGGDQPHVKNLIVQGLLVEVRQEGDKLNLLELHRRLKSLAGPGAEPSASDPAQGPKSLRIDELALRGVKARVTGVDIAGVAVPDQELALPDIELTNLEGEPAEIALQVVTQLAESTTGALGLPSVADVQALGEQVAAEAAAQVEQAGQQAVQGAQQEVQEGVHSAVQNLLGGGE
ncbi:MAG: hypothetical protein AAF288_07970 [Planctomycetota bacterium]